MDVESLGRCTQENRRTGFSGYSLFHQKIPIWCSVSGIITPIDSGTSSCNFGLYGLKKVLDRVIMQIINPFLLKVSLSLACWLLILSMCYVCLPCRCTRDISPVHAVPAQQHSVSIYPHAPQLHVCRFCA